MKHFWAIFLVTLALCNFSLPAFAQEESAGESADETVDYFYELPTMKKLSQLYWALSMNDIENNKHIDNYLMINECDIHKDYFGNELEWQYIRNSAKAFIKANKESFPQRFEFIQPIKLGEYDTEHNRFDILQKFRVEGVRRFEVLSTDHRMEICDQPAQDVEGYPRSLVIELSRPFTLTHLNVTPEIAEGFIKEKLKAYEGLHASAQNEENLYDTRIAYIVMKVKIFAGKEMGMTKDGINVATVYGVLEGFDIYATQEKEMPIFSKSFRKRKKPTSKGNVTNNDGDISDPLPESAPKTVEDEDDY